MKFNIPGNETFEIQTIILDLNETLAVGGIVVSGVAERIVALKSMGYSIVLFSGDTRGNAQALADNLGITFIPAGTAEEKRIQTEKIGPMHCASIGNGRIDLEMLEIVQVAIVTLQAEGVHTKSLAAADIVVPTILDALDLFIDANRLIATLRK